MNLIEDLMTGKSPKERYAGLYKKVRDFMKEFYL